MKDNRKHLKRKVKRSKLRRMMYILKVILSKKWENSSSHYFDWTTIEYLVDKKSK